MAGGYGPPLIDFSPLANLANTFFDARDKARKRKFEDLQLQAGDEWAKMVAGGLDAPPATPAAPSMSLSSLGQAQTGKLPAFAGGQTRPMTMPASPELAEAIKEHATAAGIDPVDLATAISYETAGTFDPWKAGPRTQWGQHRGLIQWGEPQAKQYGVYEGMPVKEQVAAAVKYLQDRGVKPGMGLLDVYSAINAGSVGRYGASDAHNGGAPGTVADKVNNQMGGHRQKAIALLGVSPADAPAQGAQNAQFQIPGQAQQAQAPTASAPPQIEFPPLIKAGLEHPNPFVRQKAAAMAQQYIAKRQEMQAEAWKIQEQEASRRRLAQEDRDFQRPYKERELGLNEERVGIDRERLDWDRTKPMTVSPEQDVISPDGTVIRAGKQKPNVKTEVINGRVVFIDQDARTALDITPQGLPNGYRPMTTDEKTQFGIPENTGAYFGPDGKPTTLPGTASTTVKLPEGEKAQDKVINEDYGKTFVEMQKRGRSAAGTKGTLRLMARLTEDPDFYSGFGAEKRLTVNKFLASLGVVDPKATAPTEVFSSLVNDVVLGKLGGSLGTGVSNSDVGFLQSTAPNLTGTKEGNRMLISITEKMMDREQAIAKLARDYAKKNGGRLDMGFEDVLAQYAEQNPLFTEQDFKAAQAAMNGSPAGGSALPIKVTSPDEARKLPKGTKIILPDGSPGVVP